ncbi:DHA2 family efflux MFS transporter permease subunit [Pseudactinotalea sp. HY160]|uniref:DHA2 family efflux MFS transporter permease subunit n=1 Tax=Pseudactinotalea sp. HY160 TaxID=2654490 RepID=UPI00128B0C0D|nr:DHA2 family efflux MFS transporter permease subunit [Pseudactinotalea sp. HY160]MPV48797.1 DHA2 family efflux MFS transporter permease subunit [Pseudactinotalea sp. HY160]
MTAPPTETSRAAWAALWAMVIGFFMILVDTTIVSVALPTLMHDLEADVSQVIWVNSGYLLAYAVPLLITGRLGDRFGPRRLYLTGLTVFTLSSLWCGLTGDITWLIVARVVQGLGASMLTPQTMAVITRTFPPHRRGQAMSLWGATAGVAMLVGPLAGGLLIDAGGWEWIFFVNVPVGLIGLVLAYLFVPRLPIHSHHFDGVGVALSAVGMFCLVFGIQEGETYDWGTIAGPISVPALIAVGVAVMVAFVLWQRRIRTDPLVPLNLFKDRNFSLGNGAIAFVGVSITVVNFPIMMYAQSVRGLSPTEAGLLLAPMALLQTALAPLAGHLVDRMAPRVLAPMGLFSAAAVLCWFTFALSPTTPIWHIVLAMTLFGVANAFLWSPLSVTATRNLPMTSAGAGSGVYNTTRQVGAVLGSAAIAVVLQSRLVHYLGPSADELSQGGSAAAADLPPEALAGFSSAMADTLLLPAIGVALAGVLALFFVGRPSDSAPSAPVATPRPAPAGK